MLKERTSLNEMCKFVCSKPVPNRKVFSKRTFVLWSSSRDMNPKVFSLLACAYLRHSCYKFCMHLCCDLYALLLMENLFPKLSPWRIRYIVPTRKVFSERTFVLWSSSRDMNPKVFSLLACGKVGTDAFAHSFNDVRSLGTDDLPN